MQFSETLNKNYEFRRLYAKGRSAVTPTLVVYMRRVKRDTNRVGITVNVKLGKAVVRNRVRRRLREIYRLHEGQFLRGWDLVVVVRARGMDADYRALEHAYLSLAKNLSLLKSEDPL